MQVCVDSFFFYKSYLRAKGFQKIYFPFVNMASLATILDLFLAESALSVNYIN